MTYRYELMLNQILLLSALALAASPGSEPFAPSRLDWIAIYGQIHCRSFWSGTLNITIVPWGLSEDGPIEHEKKDNTVFLNIVPGPVETEAVEKNGSMALMAQFAEIDRIADTCERGMVSYAKRLGWNWLKTERRTDQRLFTEALKKHASKKK